MTYGPKVGPSDGTYKPSIDPAINIYELNNTHMFPMQISKHGLERSSVRRRQIGRRPLPDNTQQITEHSKLQAQ